MHNGAPGKVRTWLVIAMALALGGGFLAWRQWFATYHFAPVQEGVLYRDGNRSIRLLATAVRKSGCKTVVALVDDREMAREPFAREAELLRAAGVELVRIPIALGGWPDSAQIRQFLAIAGDRARQPVLVHCAQGVRRTGMMVAAFQESVLGYDRQKTKDQIRLFGHTADGTAGDLNKFIDNYDPAKHELTAALDLTDHP